MNEVLPLRILSDNYTYLVLAEGQTLCIDPGESRPVHRLLQERNIKLDGILVTHQDMDHVGGVKALSEIYECPVFGPNLTSIPSLTHPLSGGEEIREGELRFTVLSTPGHQGSDLSFYFQDLEAVFCGDTLFTGGCGRMNTGDPELFWKSIQKINQLPANTRIYCGHEYALENYEFSAELTGMRVFMERYQWAREQACSVPSALEEERRSNIFMRAGDPAVAAICGMKGKAPWEVFACLREEKDHF